MSCVCRSCNHPLGYERVYLPLCQVADTTFHIISINIFLFTNWNNTKCNTGSSRLDKIRGHYIVAVVTALRLPW